MVRLRHPNRRYERTASRISSGGNRKPVNAERAGTGTTFRGASRVRSKPAEPPCLGLSRWPGGPLGEEIARVINSRSASSAPAGYRFPREVIAVAVRWYLRYGLSYRDVEELLAERGIEVDHVTVYRWVQTFTPAFIDSARPARHATGDRWFIDETYVKVAERWSYLYRAIDSTVRSST
jgi:DDE domain